MRRKLLLVLLLPFVAACIPSRELECVSYHTRIDRTPWGQVEEQVCDKWTYSGWPAFRKAFP